MASFADKTVGRALRWITGRRGEPPLPPIPTPPPGFEAGRYPEFLVTGTGRSGTSAVARLLHEVGLIMGHDLNPADEHNVEGYFEELPLIAVNDAILHRAGIGPPFTWASRKKLLDAAKAYRGYMRDLAAAATPAWKDPRFCWTLEAWLDVLPVRPRVIVCLRSPDEVAASARHLYGMLDERSRDAVLYLWRAQYERLLEVLDEFGLQSMCVEYGELHRDPARAIEPLTAFVGRALDPSLVRQDLRHHDMTILDDLRPLYDRVRALGA